MARHAGLVVVIWILLLPVAVAGSGVFARSLTTHDALIHGSESERAAQLLADRFPGAADETDLAVLHSGTSTWDDVAFRDAVTGLLPRLRAVSGVREVIDPATDARLVSADRHTVLVPVGVDGEASARQRIARDLAAVAAVAGTAAVTVQVTGTSPIAVASIDQSDEDIARADAIALPVAAVILVIAFGALLAAAIPLGLAGMAVVTAFGVLGALSAFWSFDTLSRTAVSMLSIALGIDYALLTVSRFREELAHLPAGHLDRGALVPVVGRTVAAAGHAVTFSGLAVMVSLAGLFVVPTEGIRGLAFGTIAAVGSMLVLALTLLPAVLTLLGRRVNAWALPWARASLAHPDPEHSRWGRIADVSQRHPLIVAVLSLGLLLGASWPVLHLRYGVADQSTAVADSPAGAAYDRLEESFPAGLISPVLVVIATDHGVLTDRHVERIAQLTARFTGDPEVSELVSLTSVLDAGFGGHAPAQVTAARAKLAGTDLGTLLSADESATVMTITPRHGTYSEQAADLVRRLRSATEPMAAATGLEVAVGGVPAQLVDSAAENDRATPRVLVVVLLTAALVLLVAFRSLLLPLKAILMNLCTVGAAFGAMILVFQEGRMGWLGLEHTGFVQIYVPLICFAFVFGLSMDYEVFMLARMQEAWRHTLDNALAVRTGIVHTARLITAAAAIMITVFASFATAGVTDVQQMGFLLATAVLIDATLVRLFLVPSMMHLMGRWNWWLPGARHPDYAGRHRDLRQPPDRP